MMHIIETVIAVIVIFCVVIGVHEYGHMVFGRLFEVKIYQFSIGMGKTLYKFTRKGTQFHIRWLLIGGFVWLSGTLPLFMEGKIMYAVIGEQNEILYVGRKGMLRKKEGLLVRITVKRAYENTVETKKHGVLKIGENTKMIIGGVDHEVEREGERLIDKPVWQQIVVFLAGAFFNFILGYLLLLMIIILTQHVSIGKDFLLAWRVLSGVILLTLKTVPHIFTKHGINPNLGGTVYVVSAVHQAVQGTFWNSVGLLTVLTAFLSISVGVMNLLPIPPLDGFHIVRACIGKVYSWSYGVLTAVTMVGIVLILCVAIAVNAHNFMTMFHV